MAPWIESGRANPTMCGLFHRIAQDHTMPIYAYRCQACGHELDALQKISDAPLTDCPACGAAALKKQLTAPAFRLKGSGWYETDFKKDGKKNLHQSDDKPKEKADSSGDKAKDKPASKPETKADKPAATTPKPKPKPTANSS
jgi:putative FmdB family regulatory protein